MNKVYEKKLRDYKEYKKIRSFFIAKFFFSFPFFSCSGECHVLFEFSAKLSYRTKDFALHLFFCHFRELL